MKGVIFMDKKQKISWGVSFGSLALVAGMVSYLGLSNGDKTNNQMVSNQGFPEENNTNTQSQDRLGSQGVPKQGQGFDDSMSGDNSSQFNQNDQYSNNSFDNGGQDFSDSGQQDQFSRGGRPSGHNRGFDTTTGGT